ncbi:MAG TPA: Holliday junction branch migration protein RuvA [Steroidobacteraceae bacterium]|nr:Holliday junction branch migration protein RuvA [Steroidobacteraceae bacterium]
MIGFLHGRIAAKTAPAVTLDVGGVGYELEAPMSTFLNLPAVGETVHLITHLVVREDAHILYGFATEEERRLFRNLLKVSGVGPKIALGVLSGMSVEGFTRCVLGEEVTTLTRIPGIGRKTAERLIIEMRDRVQTASAGSGLPALRPAGDPHSEAFDALVALQYKPAEASRLLKGIAAGTHSTEELIRLALQGAIRE